MSSASLPRVATWGLVLFFVLGVFLQAFHFVFGAWFVQVFVFLCLPWTFHRFSRQAPAKALGFLPVSPLKAAAGTLLGMLCWLAVVLPLMQWMTHLFPASWIEMFDGRALFSGLSGMEQALMLGAVVLAAPLCEEVFFRGFIQPKLIGRWGAPLGLLVTSVLFSLIHMDPVGFLARVALGSLFGWLAYAGGSLWVSISAHASYNLFVCILFFSVGGETSLEPVSLSQGVLLCWLVLGAGGMIGLLWLLGFSPPLAACKPEASSPLPPTPPIPPMSRWRILRPWVLAAVGSFVLLVAVDHRGIALNVFDTVMAPLPSPGKLSELLAHGNQEKERMQALRQKAHKGEVELQEYFEFRRQLSLELRALQADKRR